MALDTAPGCPWAEGMMTMSAKPDPNILGWSCRSPSSSHTMPSPTWMWRAVSRGRAGLVTPGPG